MSMKQKKQKQPLSKTFKKIATNKVLYIMLVPCMIYTFIFSYYPLTGWIMAFENYKPAKGYWGSKFVGFDQFRFYRRYRILEKYAKYIGYVRDESDI